MSNDYKCGKKSLLESEQFKLMSLILHKDLVEEDL